MLIAPLSMFSIAAYHHVQVVTLEKAWGYDQKALHVEGRHNIIFCKLNILYTTFLFS
jgi:hypothetical protein